MNNRLVKMLCMIMCTAFFIAFFPTIFKIDAAGSYTSLKYEKGGMEFFDKTIYDSYKKNNQLPTLPREGAVPFSIKKGTNTYYLNYRLFTQKNLVVYGNYKSVPGNYFKCGYQLHNDLDNKMPEIEYDGGYFLKPEGISCKGKEQNPETHGDKCKTNRGEWKYLGFDANGEVFSNMWMINVATVTTFRERNWIKEPWSDKNEVNKRLTASTSTYNNAAYNDSLHYNHQTVQKLKDWMYNTFNSVNKFSGIPDGNGHYDPNVYQYLYVQSAPTIQYSGSGKMWHVRPTGSIWYQTFSIPILKNNKYDLPVKCYVTLASSLPSIPESGEQDSQRVRLQFKVQGVLEDDEYYKDSVTRSAFYTRQDIKNWDLNIDKIAGLQLTDEEKKSVTVVPKSAADNQGTATITIDITVADIKKLPKSGDKYQLVVEATAKVAYKDTHSQKAEGNNKFLTNNFKALVKKESLVIDIPTLQIRNHIGETAFDGVPFRDATDSTDMSAVKSTELYINGEAVDYDKFFSGSYTFPTTSDKNGYFAEVICRYNLDKSKIVLTGIPEEKKQEILSAAVVEYVSTDYVYVYPTKPIAQFKLSSNSWKQNRIINVENTSVDGNIQLVLDKYPIVEYRWSYGGDTTHLYKGTDSDLRKQLQYKEPGSYSLTLECKNTLGKWSDQYTVEFQVLEDIAPNIELNLADSVVTRNDQISAWHYDVNSTDGDRVTAAKIELWYDNDNNGSVDTLIQKWNGLGDFPKYSPTQLGYYKFFIFAQDEFIGVNGQDTLCQYVTESDKKSASLECDFWVDNYQPLSDIYVDAPIARPNVDLYIMRDKELAQDKYEYITSNQVAMENALLGRNIIPNINIWDMKTYEYSTPASISSNTGTSYPTNEIPYTSAGYSGKLQRTSVTDNGGYHDFGHYETRMETKTISSGGGYSSGHGYGGSTPSSSISYSDGEGYTGSMSIQNYVYTSTPCGHPISPTHGEGYFNWTRSWSGYSGTASRTVSYWVPNMQWVANYMGYYSGTIYKYVRQPYTDTWRGNSSKYILYISDGNISELSDFNSAAAKTDAKVILAGTYDIQKQYPDCAKFIDATDKTVQEILNEALEYISEETPEIEQIYLLQNQQFTLNVGEDDLENDEIISGEMQYVQDKDYFDNPTGQEPDTQTDFNSDTGWKDVIKNSFSNVGKYQIYRRVKDKPSGANGENYSYYSGATEVDIYIHRRPIADAVLDWKYDSQTGACKTIWIDKSYDLDHNISRADTDKGIVERKIMFRKDSGEWQYFIPDTLTYGSYDVIYYVKDMEGAWSDPWTYHFTLDDKPQFTASARAYDSAFTLKSIPASEYIEGYNLWTRQPNPVQLEINLTPTVLDLPSTKTVNYQEGVTGTQAGQDINWKNQILQIPDIYPDGIRTFTITARDKLTGAETPKTFSVNVFTPINLVPALGGKTLNTNVQTKIYATTTRYPYVTRVNMQYGTPYQSYTLNMTPTPDGNIKSWAVNYTVPDTVPDGTYTAQFTSINPSGKAETKYVTYKVSRNRPPEVNILKISPQFIYEGDSVSMTFEVTDPDPEQVLTSKVTVKKGSEVVYSAENVSIVTNGEKKTFTMKTPKLTETGTYTISITTTDQYFAQDEDTTTFTVHGLTIKGCVNHTPTWKTNWDKYNKHLADKGKATYGNDAFFNDEKYVLSAVTTDINSGSTVTVSNVKVKILERSYGPVSLASQTTNTFKGEMWNEDMKKDRWKGTYATFVFTVTYSNGTIKTDTVKTYVVNDDYWRIRMAF
ncbi:hypothetical protein [Clostridium sp. BNL1100]|uniref:Athe_2463 domain-containing protein n=1 Tax=Clostridium sp. BNL1100 TaxID=755731 RepID=UPI00024A77DA|nr:hypothetical protein [Clostridium sp. BNL1100]AEY65631.1 hypothetical protein Clo1100_1396 [Clostridium sp. BNL1100]